MDSDVRSNRPGLGVAGALLALALSATPALAGGHKHHKMTFELVQGFMVQPQAAAQPIYVPYPVPVPVPSEGYSAQPSPQGGPSAQGTLLPVPKAQALASPPLFSTTAVSQMLTPLPQPSLAATPMTATPILQAMPMQAVQAVPMQAVQAVPMVQAVQAVPMVQAVQAAPMQVIQTSAVQAMPVQLQSLPTAPAVQATSTLTPVQFLLPTSKHCFFGRHW